MKILALAVALEIMSGFGYVQTSNDLKSIDKATFDVLLLFRVRSLFLTTV